MTPHCMLDLETLSTRHNARILAIGAVMFDEKGVHHEFYQAVKVAVPERLLNVASVFNVSADTLKWWSQQSEDARAVFWDKDAVDIVDALRLFSSWVFLYGDAEDVRMWGNGASFDNAILATAYDLMDITLPWKFWHDRCYRTIKNMFNTPPPQRQGVHHNALDDARYQAQHLISMDLALR